MEMWKSTNPDRDVDIIYFSNFEQAMNIAGTLDSAESREVWIGDLTGIEDLQTGEKTGAMMPHVLDETHQAIINVTTGAVAQIASSKYQILQHHDFFSMTLNALDGAGLSGNGRFVPTKGGDRWKMQVLFDNIKVAEPKKGNNLNVGGEFSNSYNATKSASGRGFYMRLSCMNQMTVRNLIPDVYFSKNHVSESQEALTLETEAKVFDYVDSLLMNSTAIEAIVEEAIGNMISFGSRDEIIPTLIPIVGAQKHAEGVFEKLVNENENVLEISKWDMYNAVTDYASHSDISHSVRETILDRAETKVLSPNAIIEIINPEELVVV